MVRYIISMAYYSDGDSTLYTEINDDVYLDFNAAYAGLHRLVSNMNENIQLSLLETSNVSINPTNARIDTSSGNSYVYQIHRLEIEDEDKEMYKVGRKKLQEIADNNNNDEE